MFFGGRLKTMPPKLLSEDAHIVTGPWPTCRSARSNATRAPGSFRSFRARSAARRHLQRVVVKKMLADWEREFPGRTEAIFSKLET